MHPSLLDGALQAAVGLFLIQKEPMLKLPFFVEQVEILSSILLFESVYAYIQKVKEDVFHVAIMNAAGVVCVKLHEVQLRALTASLSTRSGSILPVRHNNLLTDYYRRWEKCAVKVTSPMENIIARSILVVTATSTDILADALITLYVLSTDEINDVFLRFNNRRWQFVPDFALVG